MAENLEQIAGERIDPRLTGVSLQNFRSENDPSTGAGVLVTDIGNDSSALERGLRPGDIIVALNRKPVRSIAEMTDQQPAPNGAAAAARLPVPASSATS